VTNLAPKMKRIQSKRPALSLREINFCVHYAECGQATEAYRSAGYPQHAAESTWVLACRVLRKPAVAAYIWELRNQACDVAQATVTKIAQGLCRAAFADLRKLYDARGRIKVPSEWPDDLALAIDGVDSQDLFETQTETDPETGKKTKRRVLVGYARKVRLTKRVEALKTLAVWRRMIGRDAEVEYVERELLKMRQVVDEWKARALNGNANKPQA
jgi:hypothetical protein